MFIPGVLWIRNRSSRSVVQWSSAGDFRSGLSRWLWLVLVGIFSLQNTLAAADVASAEADLANSVSPLIARHQGEVAVYIRHLPSGATFKHREQEPMPACSLVKLPVMAAAYQQVAAGKADLTKRVTFRDSDRTSGSGILSQQFSDGLELPLRDCIRLMIAFSDNSATNLVLREIGLNTVNEFADRYECPDTRIYAQVFHPESSIDPAESRKWGLGKTTARDMARMLELLEQRKLDRPEVCQAMLEHLEACTDRDRLGRLLPGRPRIAMKTGAVTSARHAVGIIETPVGPLIVCVLTSANKDRSWSEDNAAYRLSQEIARAAWRVFQAEQLPPPVDGLLKAGHQGELVEDLQRTLNARLAPSSQVTVDGEFGPQTEAALRVFQERAGIPVTGQTDHATWQALGPIPVADAAEVRAVETRVPADPLSGPPPVSCRSWLIGNPDSGEILASHEAETPLDIASTTKIMTAYVVLKHATQKPEWLEQTLVVSPRAAATPGSSAKLRAGESCRVDELLYGLLLPSGNDASVALAEHVGGLVPPLENSTTLVAEARFVAEMNQMARELGMTQTTYRNPHGLTDPEHRSSARDQFRLVSAAIKLPRLREIISSRAHVGQLAGPGGYTREVAWKNTNRLLNHEGFAGVKTGTTSAAGACLISLAKRDQTELVIVVLGATSSDGRYFDTRNLVRWQWQQLSAPK